MAVCTHRFQDDEQSVPRRIRFHPFYFLAVIRISMEEMRVRHEPRSPVTASRYVEYPLGNTHTPAVAPAVRVRGTIVQKGPAAHVNIPRDAQNLRLFRIVQLNGPKTKPLFLL
jgi:hypothetical protein